ncbi:MAG TPA: thiamine-phosphate kinase [Bryobacteraceae bacterium]|jgi:thiamine-monophosphate kinase
MRETLIIERIRQLAQDFTGDKTVIRGIGDDCAILRPRAHEDLVFTSDFVLEGRHFTLDTHKPADIGHKALARSLSDLAAMGAEPVFCLVSLAIPASLSGSTWITGFYKGLLALAKEYRVILAGGDLARFEKVVVDVTCCGRVPRGTALLRSGAKPGDRIYVTGELGGSAHGFETRKGKHWKRHLRPEPRIAAGIALRKAGISAAMDLSDGLSLDLARLCKESRTGAEISSNRLPLASGASIHHALHGGEDYELLFTAPPKLKIRLPVTEIGVITKQHPGKILLDGASLLSKGFDHFS